MAPRKASKGAVSKSTPAKKKVVANGFKLADPVPPGVVIRDVTRNEWILGKSIGQGGFGEIYLASDDPSREVRDTDKYVVKVEPHSNGPLFTEMHCYMRIAKPDLVDSWMKEHKLKRFGMPKYMGSGSFEYKNQKYRFMVMERFGSDLQKILERHNKKFSFKTVYQVGIEVIDVLEYIHDKGYIHADIKASNLLVGFQKGTEDQVFLVDYGLACRYAIDGVHKEYKYDGRKAHDGTIEFTSRDAHIGAHSRRGDLEILGYNLAQWLCAKLPWEDNLPDCDYVANQKRWYMDNVEQFMDKCFPDVVPPGLQEFLSYIASLTFDEAPDYEKCRNILRKGLVERGYKDDGKLVFMSATPKAASKKPKSRIASNKVSTSTRNKKKAPSLDESVDMFLDSGEEVESDGEDVVKMEVTPLRNKTVGRTRSGQTPTPQKNAATPVLKIKTATPVLKKNAATLVLKIKTATPITKRKAYVVDSPKQSTKSAASTKRLRKETTSSTDGKDDSLPSIDSSGSDDFEKENINVNSARKTTSRVKKVTMKASELVVKVKTVSPIKKKVTKTKKNKVGGKKLQAQITLDPSTADMFKNPTPAMRELLAKRALKK